METECKIGVGANKKPSCLDISLAILARYMVKKAKEDFYKLCPNFAGGSIDHESPQ